MLPDVCFKQIQVFLKKAKPQHTLKPYSHLMKNIPTTNVQLNKILMNTKVLKKSYGFYKIK